MAHGIEHAHGCTVQCVLQHVRTPPLSTVVHCAVGNRNHVRVRTQYGIDTGNTFFFPPLPAPDGPIRQYWHPCLMCLLFSIRTHSGLHTLKRWVDRLSEISILLHISMYGTYKYLLYSLILFCVLTCAVRTYIKYVLALQGPTVGILL